MKRKSITFASLLTAAAMVSTAVFSSGLGVASAKQVHATASAAYPPAPKDPWAKQDRAFKGQTITYYGGSVGTDHLADVPLAKAFTKSTGIKIKIVEQPSTGGDALAQLLRTFSQGSSSIDVTRIDVVWPGTLARYLVDLNRPLAANKVLEYKSIVANDTVGGHLVAMPYQGDFGMLYYRTDLLHQYGYSAPPKTWAELTSMAEKIQTGEQKSNNSFYGFLFQGNSYEGLTCNATEWIASYGGGNFINPITGKVGVNNPHTISALSLAQSWVGKISPKGVTTYQEGDTQNAFLAGNAAFARNWPYMYSLTKGSKVEGKVAVAPLPHGPAGKSSATVGGWQIAVSKFSKHKGASLAWARYYSSRVVSVWRGTYAGIVPTMPSVNNVKSVKKAQPYLTTVGNHTARVVRPSSILGPNYPKGSTYIYQDINSILTGSDVKSTVATLEKQLKSLKKV